MPNILGYLIGWIVGGTLGLIIQVIGLAISLTLRVLYGNADFSRYPDTNAPFKAGY
jgi:Platelet-activating factor acetylhydrolase, isoform II